MFCINVLLVKVLCVRNQVSSLHAQLSTILYHVKMAATCVTEPAVVVSLLFSDLLVLS